MSLSAHLRRGRCRWTRACVVSVARVFATLCVKSWCCWLRQRVVCLLDSRRCSSVTECHSGVSFTGGGSPISFLLVSMHCPWIVLAFTAIGEGKCENRNSVPKRDVVMDWIDESILYANERKRGRQRGWRVVFTAEWLKWKWNALW